MILDSYTHFIIAKANIYFHIFLSYMLAFVYISGKIKINSTNAGGIYVLL